MIIFLMLCNTYLLCDRILEITEIHLKYRSSLFLKFSNPFCKRLNELKKIKLNCMILRSGYDIGNRRISYMILLND